MVERIVGAILVQWLELVHNLPDEVEFLWKCVDLLCTSETDPKADINSGVMQLPPTQSTTQANNLLIRMESLFSYLCTRVSALYAPFFV